MIQLFAIQLADQAAERVRRNHAEAIAELQKQPFAFGRIIPDVRLLDGVAVPIAHGFGRVCVFVTHSIPRGALAAGYIEEIRDGSHDRSKFVTLKASGFGAVITVDLVVM